MPTSPAERPTHRRLMALAWALLALAAVAALAAAFSGCAADPGHDQRDKDEFVFVCPIQDNPYWQQCVEGIAQADKELGTHTRVVGPETAEGFDAKLPAYLEEAIEERPAGIMGYAGLRSMEPLIDEAAELGIPFVAIDSDAPDTRRVAYVGIDSYNAGYLGGEALRRDLSPGDAVGVLMSTRSSEHEMKVLEAFNDAISDFDLPVVDMDETGGTEEAANERTCRMLAEHPQIRALFVTGSSNATGAAEALKELGRSDVVLVGFDDIDANLALLREGLIDALVVQNPYDMGYEGVHALKAAVEDGSLPKTFYDVGMTLVTMDNVDSYR